MQPKGEIMTGRVHSFQSLGTVDGPGVRTVLFLQGCPLRCPYCHNPDTWDKESGTAVTVDDAVKNILRYRSYFGKDGGATVSGGEPLLQADFVYELFSRLKEENINTALDTSGVIMNDKVKKLLEKTDIVLLDIKFSDDELYKKYIGVGLSVPLAFLAECERAKKRVIIRQVITPGINDAKDDVLKLREILKPFTCVEKIELLPFRKLCKEKYESMNIYFPFGDRKEMPQEEINRLQKLL